MFCYLFLKVFKSSVTILVTNYIFLHSHRQSRKMCAKLTSDHSTSNIQSGLCQNWCQTMPKIEPIGTVLPHSKLYTGVFSLIFPLRLYHFHVKFTIGHRFLGFEMAASFYQGKPSLGCAIVFPKQ